MNARWLFRLSVIFILSLWCYKSVNAESLSQQILKEALVFYTQGKYEKAKKLLEKLLQIHRPNPIASSLLAKIIYATNNKIPPKKIEPKYIKKIKYTPDIPTIGEMPPQPSISRSTLKDNATQPTEENRLIEICTLTEEGKLDEALSKLVGWFLEYPEGKLKYLAWFVKAKILYLKKNKEGALKILNELSTVESELAGWVYLERARIHYENANFNEVLSDTSKVIQLLTKQKTLPYGTFKNFLKIPTEIVAQAHFLRANIYKTKGEYTNAVVEYKTIINDYNKSSVAADATFSLADIYDNVNDLRDYVQAYQMYKFLVERYPHSIFVKRAKFRMHYIEENFL